jgi:hypothetical protein
MYVCVGIINFAATFGSRQAKIYISFLVCTNDN